MLIRFPRLIRTVATSMMAALWFGACVTAGVGAEDKDSVPVFPDGGFDRFVVDATTAPDGAPPPGHVSMLALCGVGECGGALPDDFEACADFDPGAAYPSTGGGSGGSGGINGLGGGQADAASDAPAVDAAMDAPTSNFQSGGASNLYGPDASAPARAPATLDAGADFGAREPNDAQPSSYADGNGAEPTYACHVGRGSDGPVHRCELAGHGLQGAPCISSRDCAPGFGCVEDDGAAKCLHFCCAGGEAEHEDGGRVGCEEGTYCTERPLRDDAGDNPLLVPVCLPADHCDLGDPFPCETTDGCTCPEGEACSIVRNDGTTSCVVPGTGAAGEPCPCGPGLFCSLATNTCVKICRTDVSGDTACGTGRCQAAVNLPEGYGLCVAMTESR